MSNASEGHQPSATSSQKFADTGDRAADTTVRGIVLSAVVPPPPT